MGGIPVPAGSQPPPSTDATPDSFYWRGVLRLSGFEWCKCFTPPTETFPLDLPAGKKNQEWCGEKEFAPPTLWSRNKENRVRSAGLRNWGSSSIKRSP